MQLPVTLEMVHHFVHHEGSSCIERANVLVVREPILRHIWEDIPKGLLEFIACQNSAGLKQVLKAIASCAKLPHAAEFVGGILAKIIVRTTEVHVLKFLERVLTDLVPWILKCGPLDPYVSSCTVSRSSRWSCPPGLNSGHGPAS